MQIYEHINSNNVQFRRIRSNRNSSINSSEDPMNIYRIGGKDSEKNLDSLPENNKYNLRNLFGYLEKISTPQYELIQTIEEIKLNYFDEKNTTFFINEKEYILNLFFIDAIKEYDIDFDKANTIEEKLRLKEKLYNKLLETHPLKQLQYQVIEALVPYLNSSGYVI